MGAAGAGAEVAQGEAADARRAWRRVSVSNHRRDRTCPRGQVGRCTKGQLSTTRPRAYGAGMATFAASRDEGIVNDALAGGGA